MHGPKPKRPEASRTNGQKLKQKRPTWTKDQAEQSPYKAFLKGKKKVSSCLFGCLSVRASFHVVRGVFFL